MSHYKTMVSVIGAVGWLWLAAPAIAANQVLNGDFEGQCYVDEDGDSVPEEWIKGGGDPPVAPTIECTDDNGPSLPGSQAMRWRRGSGSLSGRHMTVLQPLYMPIDASIYSALELSLDVKVISHNLEAGGTVSPAFEWPVRVAIVYTLASNPSQSQQWRYGFYLANPGDGRVDDPGSGIIPVYEDTLVPQGVWTSHTFDLLTELPDLGTITRIEVGGAGWAYEGLADNVVIAGSCFGGLCPPGLPIDPDHRARKHRYITVDTTTNGNTLVDLRVELTELRRCAGDLERACLFDIDCAASASLCTQHPDVGLVWWVRQPQIHPLSCDPEWFARVDVQPLGNVWTEKALHIGDCEIVPGATYEIRACDPFNANTCSPPRALGTIRPPLIAPGYRGNFGDVAGPADPITGEFTPPDGIGNVIDISAYLKTNQNCGTSNRPQCHVTWIDLHGNGFGNPPNYILNVSDLQMILFGQDDERWTDVGGNLNPGDCP